MKACDIDTIELHLEARGLWSLHHLRECRSQRDLIAEVHVSALQELLYLRACCMQAGQDGEDRLLALLDFLVEHIIGLIELGETRRTVDDSDGVDIVEFVLTIVNHRTQLILMNAQQKQMRRELTQDYHKYIDEGTIDDDDLDLWVEGYNAYHDLGHNGIMDKRKDDLIELNAHPRKK